jgi:hypothetical protein
MTWLDCICATVHRPLLSLPCSLEGVKTSTSMVPGRPATPVAASEQIPSAGARACLSSLIDVVCMPVLLYFLFEKFCESFTCPNRIGFIMGRWSAAVPVGPPLAQS